MSRHADTVSALQVPHLKQGLSDLTLPNEQSHAVVRQFQTCYSDYAGSSDPTALPASCNGDTGTPAIKSLFTTSIKLANARNYADTFELCLYVLAVFTAGLLPLALGLVRKKTSI